MRITSLQQRKKVQAENNRVAHLRHLELLAEVQREHVNPNIYHNVGEVRFTAKMPRSSARAQ